MREKLDPRPEELQQLIRRSEDPLVVKDPSLVVGQKPDLQVRYEPRRSRASLAITALESAHGDGSSSDRFCMNQKP